MSLFHWTDAVFDRFEQGEFGFHFGTKEAAEQRHHSAGQTVRSIFKECYLNVTNPVVIDYDSMTWTPFSLAYILNRDGFLSDIELGAVLSNEGAHSRSYDAPAAEALRSLLKNKGYDGILYRNDFEGDTSVIVLDASQIYIVADHNGQIGDTYSLPSGDGTGRDSYTQNTENALSETERQRRIQEIANGDFSGIRRFADMLETQQNPQRAAVGVDSRAQNSGIVRDSGVEIGVRQSDMELAFKKMSARQRQELYAELEEHTGAKIVEDVTLLADGEYDPATKTIRINPNRATPMTVIKHELTHYIESSGILYQDFMNYAMEKSDAFRDWLASKGHTLDTMKQEIIDRYAEKGVKLDAERGASAEQEILANFAAEKLFTDITALRELGQKNRTLFQRLKHFVLGIVNKFRGTPAETDLQRLERMFAAALPKADGTSFDGAGDTKKFIDPNFSSAIDAWDQNKTGFRFRVGTVSEPLRSVGVDPKEIYWDSSKIKRILSEHPQMTIDVIKQVPNILENPILVMESNTVSGRLTLFGEVYDSAGSPVLAVLELSPKSKNGRDLDIIMIASAYGKDGNLQNYISKSNILYVDPNKNRTNRWLTVNRLQLPLPSSTTVGSSDPSIAQAQPGVNTQYTQDGTKKFSIQRDSAGNEVVVVDTDQGIFVGAEPSEYSRIMRQYFNERFKGVTLPLGNNGDVVSMSKKLPGEYAYPHTVLHNRSPEYRAKMKAITELDNLLLTARNHYYSRDTKGNPEATFGWDYYDVEFLCDGMQVSGLINIANSEKGRVFYDITKIKVAPAISERHVALLAHSPFASQEATDTFRITENYPSVNTQYTQDGTKKFIAPDATAELPGDQLTDDELLAQLRRRGWGNTPNPRLKHFVLGIVNKFRGTPAETELERLERMFAEAVEEANRAGKQSNVITKYSISDRTVIDLSEDQRLITLVGGKTKSARHAVVMSYILDELGGNPIRLSDGRQAFVDKRDAHHIAERSGSKKLAAISNIKRVVEEARLVAHEESTKEGKHEYFWYYEAYVRLGEDVFPVYLNVGRAKNDASLHIYDITQKLRDTVHRVNDVMRPVGYALGNGVPSEILTQPSGGVNTQYTQDGTKKFIAPDATAELPGDQLTDDELLAQLRRRGWGNTPNPRLKHFVLGIVNKFRGTPAETDLQHLERLFTEAVENNRSKDVAIENGNIKFSIAEDTSSIREQIAAHMDKLNGMSPVFESNVPMDIRRKYDAAQWAIRILKQTGYQVDRQNFGTIYFQEKDIKAAAEYADTPAEKAAFAAVPRVLKRGIEIGRHQNHKGRSKTTVTFAAPVVLNGVRGNMAVVVNLNGNRYTVHRIVSPDGSVFSFSENTQKNTEQESYQGVPRERSLADTTSSVSNTSIANQPPGVNTYSTQDGTKKFIAPETTVELPGDQLTDDELLAQLRRRGWGNTPNPRLKHFVLGIVNKFRSTPAETELERLERMFAAALPKAESAGDGKIKYSIGLSFAEQIQQILNGTFDKEHSHLFVRANTPKVYTTLEKVSIPDLPIVMSYDNAVVSLFDTNEGTKSDHNHGVGEEMMCLLPQMIEDPLYVVVLPNGRINAILENVDSKGRHYFISLELEVQKPVSEVYSGGYRGKQHLLLTVFGARENYIKKILSTPENVVVYDKKKDSNPRGNPEGNGLNIINGSESLDPSIAQPPPGVNGYSTQDGTKKFIAPETAEIRAFENSEEQLARNTEEMAETEAVYTVPASALENSGKPIADIYRGFFTAWGGQLFSEELGVIDLKESSIRSERRHGNTAQKIAAIEAIPAVIANGKIIFVGEKNNGRVQRILVAAPIRIGDKPYYMGIMVQRDIQNQRLYLHDVAIEEETSATSLADLSTTGASGGDEHLFTTSILRRALQVKRQLRAKRFIAPETSATFRSAAELSDEELAAELRRRGMSDLPNPLQVAQFKPADALTTPVLRRNGPMNAMGDGTSAFADSVQNADIFSDELKRLAAEDEQITRYDVITNADTLREANERINTGGRAFVQRLMQRDSDTYSTEDLAAALILISRYEKIGDHRTALVLMEKVREAGTAHGQAVQILSLLSRLTPDGMVMYAQLELSRAYEVMVKGKTNKWIERNKDRFELTDEDIEFIRRRGWGNTPNPRLKHFVLGIVNKFRGTPAETDLQRLERMFAEAVEKTQATPADGEKKFSIQRDANGENVVVIGNGQNIFWGLMRRITRGLPAII